MDLMRKRLETHENGEDREEFQAAEGRLRQAEALQEWLQAQQAVEGQVRAAEELQGLDTPWFRGLSQPSGPRNLMKSS